MSEPLIIGQQPEPVSEPEIPSDPRAAAEQRLRGAVFEMSMTISMIGIEMPGATVKMYLGAEDQKSGGGRLYAAFNAKTFFEDLATFFGEQTFQSMLQEVREPTIEEKAEAMIAEQKAKEAAEAAEKG